MADDLSFLREIDESLRIEKLEQFWQRFGNWVIAGCACIVLATAGSVVWKNHQREAHMRATSVLLAAQKLAGEGKYEEAEKALAAAPEGKGGTAALARLARAAALSNAGKNDEARTLYGQVAGDASADAALRNYATLRLSTLGVNQQPPAAPEASVADPASAFAPLGEELQAGYLLKTGKAKAAQELLRHIAEDNDAPRTARSRAMELLATIPREVP